MKFPRTAKAFKGQIDSATIGAFTVTVLLFFWLQSSFVIVPGTNVTLPKSGPIDTFTIAGPILTATIDQRGYIYFQDQLVQLSKFKESLKKIATQKPGLTLILLADQAAKLDPTLKAIDIAQEIGISQVLISRRPSAEATNLTFSPPKK
jgi:biopolymer transport protein ExbD